MEKLNGLETEFLGQNLMFYQSVDSTQKKVKALKAPQNGTLVIADNQTEGVGTHSRKWYTGNEKNIAMSFVLLPNCSIVQIQRITILIAECIVKTLKNLYAVELNIKEPNDIYCHNKKVGGILTETVCKGETVNKIYIGIGINVNQDEFPGNLSKIATSLKQEFRQEFDREKIMVHFLNEFEKIYLKLIK